MATSLDDYARRRAAQLAGETIFATQGIDPALAADAARLGRQFGIPPTIAQADLPNLQQRQERDRAQSLIQRYPAIGKWASEPSHAAMAQGDWAKLGKAAETWTVGSEALRLAKRTVAGFTSGIWGVLQQAAETQRDYNPIDVLTRKITGTSIGGQLSAYTTAQQKAGQAIVDANPSQVQNFVGRNLIQGLDSTVSSLTGIGAAVLTRNPSAALGVMGATVGGNEYAKARDRGLSSGAAAIYGTSQGMIEAATEKIPVSRLLGDLAAKTPFAKTFFRQIVSEIPGEQAATLLQDLNEWAALNPDKPFIDYVNERPTAAAQTLLQTISGATATTGAVKAVEQTARLVDRATRPAQEAERAASEQAFLDKAMSDAADSNVRKLSTDAYEALVAQHSEGTGAENVFIPAEKLRTFFQDADFDYRGDEFWGGYAEQIDEGVATGGDVVIPTAKAVANLSGTPVWDAVKADARLSPGGASPSEAEAFNADIGAYFDELNDSIAAQMEADDKARAPRQKIADDIRNKLMNAGYRPSEATTNAEWVASRYETRAARLGRELTGDETAALEVNQVLPKGLAPIVAAAPDAPLAETLRSVIEAMRGGSTARKESTRKGPSLVEFIRKRGGINNTGGDLESMGFAPLKGFSPRGAAKIIAARSIKRSAKKYRGALGQDMPEIDMSKSPNVVFQEAVAAGYFPEIADYAETAGQAVDLAPFYEALDSEMRGTKRYAASADTTTDDDRIAEAAVELARILDQADLDPATATDRQIAKAVEAYRQASQDGYQQGLFDDPDQPAQTMTQRQRAELDAMKQQSMIRKSGQKPVSDMAGSLFDIARDQRSLFQTYADGPRGQITFGSGTSIELFEARDASTFVHEMGHNWLEELRFDAETNSDVEQLATDWQTVQGWFKANGHPIENGVIPTEAHELWARGVERFLMEGKAPNVGLRRVFETFKAWLTQIYKIADALRAPITPEIREVMERLIATDEQIAETRQAQALEAGFTDAAQAGMSDAEFAAYRAAASEARDTASDTLLKRVMATIRRERTKEWNDEAETVRADVTESVNARPEFRALNILRTGNADGSKGPNVKLERAWLVEAYGDGVLSELPRQVPPVHADSGTDADIIAEMAGFLSGDEMVRTLIAIEARRQEMKAGGDKRSVRVALIEDEVKAVMRDRYGDALTDGSIEEEALAAVHNERQGELMATELRQLARQTSKRPTPYSIARDWARTKIASGKVADTTSGAAIQQYARAARKAGKAFEEAILADDRNEAFKQKQAQMLNNALVAEAGKAKDAVEKAVERMGKIAKRKTMKSVDQAYLERAQSLMDQVEFDTRSQRSIDRQESFEEWAAARQAEGHDLVVPPSFAETLGTTNWSRLTVESLLGLDEAVAQIIHMGRFKQKLIDAKEERDFDAVLTEAVDSAGNLPPTAPPALTEPTRWESIKAKIADMDAALLKMETVFDWLDGGNPNGIFNRHVFRPIADAQARRKTMADEYGDKLQALLKGVPQKTLKRWRERIVLPELTDRETGEPSALTRQQLISMALNVGNTGNLYKLARGHGWNEQAILDVLDRELTADEWGYVQNVWDTINELWPEIEALEKRVNGVAPEKIEPRAFVTQYGSMRGGYFPVVYDPRRNYQAEADAAKSADALFEGSYSRATTPKGFTKERTRVARPIFLSLSVVQRHVNEVIHDITHREAVMQADRFLSNMRVMKAVDRTLGPAVRQQFRPWLQHIANEFARERAGQAGWESFLAGARTNATLVGMGFRVSTMMMQIAGYSNSIERVGAKWVGTGLAAWGRDPVGASKFVMQNSQEVAGRMQTLDRDMERGLRDMQGLRDPASQIKRFAFHGIGWMDRVVVVPTWLGAYNRAQSEGMEHDDAIAFADKTVRQSQGAGAAKDLASVQRGKGTGGEAMKLLTMFYSYQSALYQRTRTLGRDTASARMSDVPALAARSLMLFVVPVLLAEFLAGRWPDDDEDWALWAFQKIGLGVVGPVPVARDVTPPMLAAALDDPSFGYSFTPVARAGDTAVNVARDLGNVVEGEETKRATRNALELTGYATGLPPGQIASATQFIVDVSYGEQDPQGVADWYEGLTKGKIKEKP